MLDKQYSLIIHYVYRVSNNSVMAKKKETLLSSFYRARWLYTKKLSSSASNKETKIRTPCFWLQVTLSYPKPYRPSDCTYHRATPTSLTDFHGRLHLPKSVIPFH